MLSHIDDEGRSGPVEKAVGVPDPVRDRAVDEEEPEGDEEEVGWKLDAVRKRPRDKGGGDDGEHHVVAGKEQRGYRGRCGLHWVADAGADVYVEEEREGCWAADDTASTLSKGEAEPYKNPKDTR